jgi:Helix-turn-helix.
MNKKQYDEKSAIKTNLSTYREKNNLSIKQVSKKLKIDRNTYSNYEITPEPMKLITIIELCKLYNITPNELLNIKESKVNEYDLQTLKQAIKILEKIKGDN